MDLMSMCGLLFPITSRHATVGQMEEACYAAFKSQEKYIESPFILY